MQLREVQIAPRSVDGFRDLVGADRVLELERIAEKLRERLRGRVVWNVNSTAAGGGVAEMLHSLLSYARGLGVDTRWVVVEGDPDFFRVTKRIHNALHGERGDGSALGADETEIYERVARVNADAICRRVRPGDIVLAHDPQTAGLVPRLIELGARVIWRCHVGADHPTEQGELAWRFLAPYLVPAHAFVFSRFAYVPEFCDHKLSVIVPPTIDPFSPKNQDLDASSVHAILVRSGLIRGHADRGAATFTREDGSPSRVDREAHVLREGPAPPPDLPLVVQVSRWDRLKDPVGVLRGFARMNGSSAALVLAGPDVRAVSDDPEGAEVFEEVVAAWKELPAQKRERVHLANLPMDDLQENAAIVNALQRHASVVVQKSMREGFGLTVTEAMWKRRPIVASAVGGIQDQIEHGISGLLLRDPTDAEAFAATLEHVLAHPELAERLGQGARSRATQLYLGLSSLARYAGLIERVDR